MFKRSSQNNPALAGATLPAGEKPFTPVYIPMHGPGARPAETETTGSPTGRRMRLAAITAVVACLIVVGGVSLSRSLRDDTPPIETVATEDEGVDRGRDSGIGLGDVLGTATGSPYPAATTPQAGATRPVQASSPITAGRPSGTPIARTSPTSPVAIVSPAPQTPVAAPAATPAPTTEPPADAPPATPAPAPKTIAVSYTDAGFSPAAVTAVAGDTITVKNDSTKPVRPVCQGAATGVTACDAGTAVAPGESWSYTLTASGTWTLVDGLTAAKPSKPADAV